MSGKKLQGAERLLDDAGNDEDLEALPHLEHFPASQIRGDTWVIGVLADLIAYSEHRELPELREALREAHEAAVQSLLH